MFKSCRIPLRTVERKKNLVKHVQYWIRQNVGYGVNWYNKILNNLKKIGPNLIYLFLPI